MGFPFEAKVGEFVAAGKTPGEAVRLVARQFPDLHQDFIARAQSPGFRLKIMMQPQGSFEEMVSRAMAAGKGRGQAVRYVVHQFPDLHQDFITRSQPGGKAVRGLSVIERMRHLAR